MRALTTVVTAHFDLGAEHWVSTQKIAQGSAKAPWPIGIWADVNSPKISVAKKLVEAIADEERLYFNEELRRPTKIPVIST